MSDILVTIQDGKLRGTTKTDLNGEHFCSFQGIPYAIPPIGALRFKAPQPPKKWADIKDATQERDECYAKNMSFYTGSEDCLYLNVFTKKITAKLKPVMVWIHGGGFTMGSSKTEFYGPEYLMTEDIVLVTFNYRLGALGFLCMEDTSLGVPGNAGLKDMVMALKWVQRNIKSFSGDPNNVTIFGESAGGAAVNYLILSPQTKSLFHKAICQSGVALNNWAIGKRHNGKLLAESLGIETNDEAVALEHLQHMSVEELYKGYEKIRDAPLLGDIRPFSPVIERPSDNCFLSEPPVRIMKSGRYHKVPMLMGYCSREGMFVHAVCSVRKRELLSNETIVPFFLKLRKNTEVYKSVVQRVKDYYFSGKDPSREDIFRLFTHNYFLLSIYNTAKILLESGTAPIYFYRFSLDTTLNFMKSLYLVSEAGACHGDDFAYLFKNSFTPEVLPNSPEDNAIRRMVKLWTNFAKYGNPTPENDPLLPISWKPLKPGEFNVLEIGSDLKMVTDPDKEAMDFWNGFFKLKYVSNSKL